jgi:hypothetical protein
LADPETLELGSSLLPELFSFFNLLKPQEEAKLHKLVQPIQYFFVQDPSSVFQFFFSFLFWLNLEQEQRQQQIFEKTTAATPTHNADLLEENPTLLTTNAATTRRRGRGRRTKTESCAAQANPRTLDFSHPYFSSILLIHTPHPHFSSIIILEPFFLIHIYQSIIILPPYLSSIIYFSSVFIIHHNSSNHPLLPFFSSNLILEPCFSSIIILEHTSRPT